MGVHIVGGRRFVGRKRVATPFKKGSRQPPFANYIAEKRTARGLSQTGLARKARIERTWLSRIEKGHVLATGLELDRIEAALRTPAALLYPEWVLEVVGTVERRTLR